MTGCPDIPAWDVEWLDSNRLVKRRGPFRCVTHTGGQSHGIGSGSVLFGLRIPDMAVAITQSIGTGEYLDRLNLDRTAEVPAWMNEPRNGGTDFHSARPQFDGHTQSAEPGECDLMGSLSCWLDYTMLWDDAFDAWRADGEDAVWPILERRLLDFVGAIA